MEPNRNATLVGALVLILVAAVGLGGVWLSRAGKENEPDRYVVYFVKQSLSGLEAGASVTMLGIKVGQIESVSIDPKDFTRVRVGLALHPGTPITMSTTALVQRNLLTGLGMIDLVGSSPTSPRLNGGGLRNDDIPEIQEGIPQLIQLQRSLPVILEHVDKVLTSTSDVLNEGNREKIARVIENLEKISGGLADSGGALKEGTREISVAIHGFLSQLDERTKKITDAFSRTSGDMSRQVGTVSGTLSDTLRAIARLVEELEHPRRLLLGPSPKDLGPGETRP